jgi:hypothetical protein
MGPSFAAGSSHQHELDLDELWALVPFEGLNVVTGAEVMEADALDTGGKVWPVERSVRFELAACG